MVRPDGPHGVCKLAEDDWFVVVDRREEGNVREKEVVSCFNILGSIHKAINITGFATREINRDKTKPGWPSPTKPISGILRYACVQKDRQSECDDQSSSARNPCECGIVSAFQNNVEGPPNT